MRKPYFMEKRMIAAAQCEDRRDGIEVTEYSYIREKAEGDEEDGKETEDTPETE